MPIRINEQNLHPTRVQFDYQPADENLWFYAYTDDQTWNGWACPFFTKEQGLALIEFLNRQSVNPAYPLASFDEKLDVFFVDWQDGLVNEPDRYQGFDTTFNGQLLHLYPIGVWTCTWVTEAYL